MSLRRAASTSGHRYGLSGVLLLITMAFFVPMVSNAQDYPTRPVKIVIPYAAGGLPDSIGRLVAEKLTQSLGQPVIVENRPGAGGNIGVSTVTTSEPDGYTLLLGATGTLTIGPSIYKRVPFKLADLAPITLIGAFDYVMLSEPGLTGKPINEIVDLAKKNPGTLKVASSGYGSESHLLIELFKLTAGAPLTHVPYKGFSLGVIDVIGNRVELLVASVPVAASLVKDRKLNALAVTGSKRDERLPDVPTFAEVGYPDVRMTSWVGLLAPSGTPQPVLLKLSSAMERILQSTDFTARMAEWGSSSVPVGPKVFTDQMEIDTKHWGEVIVRANIQKIE